MPRPARPAICAISAAVQPARAVAVVLVTRRAKGDVVNVHVQAHADRVGGDQEIDLLLSWYSATWALRVRGEPGEPITTAQAAATDGGSGSAMA